MTRILMCGWEIGSTRAYDGTNTGVATPTTTNPRTGTYCQYLLATQNVSWVLPAVYSELYFRLGARLISSAYAVANIIGFGHSSANTLNICSDNAGGLYVVRGTPGGGTLLLSDTGIFPMGDWCCLEGHIVFDGAVGVVQLKVDGVDVADASGLDTGATVWVVRPGHTSEFGAYPFNVGMIQYIDDLAINDVNGTENNSWIGRGGIYPVCVNAAGTHSEFTPSAGSNWECVDEVPPDDDTSYVESATVGHRDLYATSGLVPADGLISAVQWCGMARLAEPGIGGVRRLVRHSGVDYESADLTVDASYRAKRDILELAPDGTPWTVAKVNALEIGQKVV